ncbi:hypothetical protein AB432_005500 [Brevibacillus brevis]|uniref:Uncharacterized protein n=1 Tax=Brevibacillus brevis TaxID=1393 RepID=A0A2Z4MDI2_BREBE|nr:hypothetical protein AB432_005500 [Brevibacillus brevis]
MKLPSDNEDEFVVLYSLARQADFPGQCSKVIFKTGWRPFFQHRERLSARCLLFLLFLFNADTYELFELVKHSTPKPTRCQSSCYLAGK